MTNAFRGVTAVLFDIDGVLVDSKDSNAAFFRALVKKAGYPEPSLEIVNKQFHTPLRWSLRDLLGIEDEEEVERIMVMGRDADVKQFHLLKFPYNLRDILENLQKRYRLGAVSSRTRGAIDEIFEILGVGDVFEVSVGVEDVTHPKPHPEPLLVALERMGLTHDEAVYIGDGHSDIDAAYAAGMRSIFLSPFEHEHATLRIDKFSDLEDVLL